MYHKKSSFLLHLEHSGGKSFLPKIFNSYRFLSETNAEWGEVFVIKMLPRRRWSYEEEGMDKNRRLCLCDLHVKVH